MKTQFYGIECTMGWWTGCGWTTNTREVLWYSSWGEAKMTSERLEAPPKPSRYPGKRKMDHGKAPPPCRVIGKFRGNVLIHE